MSNVKVKVSDEKGKCAWCQAEVELPYRLVVNDGKYAIGSGDRRKRRFIGCDIDEKCVETSLIRCKEAYIKEVL